MPQVGSTHTLKKAMKNPNLLYVANFQTTNTAQSPSLQPTNREIKYQKFLCPAHQIYPQGPSLLYTLVSKIIKENKPMESH